MVKVQEHGQKRQKQSLWTGAVMWWILVLTSLTMNLAIVIYVGPLCKDRDQRTNTRQLCKKQRRVPQRLFEYNKEMGSSAVPEISVSLTSGSRPVAEDSIINLDQWVSYFLSFNKEKAILANKLKFYCLYNAVAIRPCSRHSGRERETTRRFWSQGGRWWATSQMSRTCAGFLSRSLTKRSVDCTSWLAMLWLKIDTSLLAQAQPNCLRLLCTLSRLLMLQSPWVLYLQCHTIR